MQLNLGNRYMVVAERTPKFTTNPLDKGYSTRFEQTFATTTEAFEMYFKLLPVWQEVTMIDLHKQKPVVVND